MSSRDWFWFLAGVLVTVAVVLTVRPWLRERPAQTVRPAIPAFALPIAAALAVVGVALGIYFLLGSPNSIVSPDRAMAPDSADASAQIGSSQQVGSSQQMSPSQQTTSSQQMSASAGSLDEVTRKLATRLATKGGSDSEWQLLAQSYDYMGRTADAKAARAHVATASSAADTAKGEPSAAALDGETMMAVADALDSHSASNATRGANATKSGATRADGTKAGGTNAGDTNAPGTAQITGTVEVAAKFAQRAGAGATLFIYAKQPNTPGPPLAVVRLRAGQWPVSFTLTDANAMVPGRNLSNAQSVQVEARISKTGDALPQSGDLVGTVTSVSPRGGQPVKISIDREIG
jgi:cytochrome c-type biogenesis protein CcmH